MTIEQRIYNADRAREVLENEAFIGAFEDLTTEITNQWKKSPARDEAGREKLWLMLSLLNKVESILKESLTDGKMARADLEHFRSKEQKDRDWEASKFPYSAGMR
jgi:hypothetical protein